MTTIRTTLAAAAQSVGAGYASKPPAQMELPGALSAAAPHPIDGLKAGRRSGQELPCCLA